MLAPAECTGYFSALGVFACRPSVVDLLPERPGVYAFYRSLHFDSHDGISSLRHLISTTSRKVSFEPNLPWEIRIDFLSTPGKVNEETVRKISTGGKAYIQELCSALFRFSILTRPWYVGATSNLRRRFGDHLDSGFIKMIEEGPRALDRNDFLFLSVPMEAHLTDDLESLFIQLGNPIYNVQRR